VWYQQYFWCPLSILRPSRWIMFPTQPRFPFLPLPFLWTFAHDSCRSPPLYEPPCLVLLRAYVAFVGFVFVSFFEVHGARLPSPAFYKECSPPFRQHARFIETMRPTPPKQKALTFSSIMLLLFLILCKRRTLYFYIHLPSPPPPSSIPKWFFFVSLHPFPHRSSQRRAPDSPLFPCPAHWLKSTIPPDFLFLLDNQCHILCFQYRLNQR